MQYGVNDLLDVDNVHFALLVLLDRSTNSHQKLPLLTNHFVNTVTTI